MSKNKVLLKNTIFLYLLTFSSQILNLITIPYQTRVLEPVTYGLIGVAVAVMIYVQLILDFGFILSATAEVVKNKSDVKKLQKIHSSVVISKIVLAIIILIIGIVVNYIFGVFEGQLMLYLLYFAATVAAALIPDYIYRGMENMKSISIRTVCIKLFFTLMIFVLVRDSADYIMIPLLLFIGNVLALIYSNIHIKKTYGISFKLTSRKEVIDIQKKSLPFFFSRFASTFYQALNTLIVGGAYAGTSMVGFYAASDKIINLSKSFSSPIADSLYPHMLQHRNFKLVKKIFLICMPPILIAGIITFVFAEPICVFIFGEGYEGVGNILRCMLPIAIVILPTYIFAFPVMAPMGIVKYANYSNIIGAIMQVIALGVLFVTNNINIYSVAISATTVEVVVFIYRVVMVYIHRKEMTNEKI